MTDDNRITPLDDDQDDFEADRNRSSVAKAKASPIGTIAIFGTAAVAIILVLLDDFSRREETDAVAAKEQVQFTTGINPQSLPQMTEEQPQPVFEQPTTTTPPAVYGTDRDAERKWQARLEARRKSKLVIFDQSRTMAHAQQAPAQPRGVGGGGPDFLDLARQDTERSIAALNASLSGSLSGGPAGGTGSGPATADRNEAFLRRVQAQRAKTVQATVLQNLTHVIAEGTLISGVLETAIQSDLPGLIRAIVSEDVYSFNGERVVIPRGSRLVGTYRSGLVTGEARLFVIWTRMIRPDGVTIDLDSRGTDALGRAGIGGYVDTKFLQRFGAATFLSLLGAGVDAAVSNDSGTVAIETGRSFERAAEIALRNQINIPPTINVRQGKRIKVFVSRDLDFSTVDR